MTNASDSPKPSDSDTASAPDAPPRPADSTAAAAGPAVSVRPGVAVATGPVVPAVPAPVPPRPPRPSLPPGWVARNWPALAGHAPRPAVFGVLVTALVAAVALVFTRPGLGWTLVAVAMAGTAVATRRGLRPRPRTRRVERVGWGIAALLLVGVGAVRADGHLFAWCVCAALACGSVALIGGRTAPALAMGGVAMLIAVGRALPWSARGVTHLRRVPDGVRLGRTVLVSVALLTVFGLLFNAADPAFAHLLGQVSPTVNGAEATRALLALLACGLLATGVGYLAAGAPVFDAVAPVPARPVRRAEWTIPLVALDLLFLAFVLVQLETLFGGRALVLRTTDLTYAQYAHAGFWQLLTVAALTLVVIAVAGRFAPRATAGDRRLLRLLLGGLAALTLVIVVSAVQRIGIYAQAYGYTRERFAVAVVEGWLGLVFLLVLVAGVRLRAGWLPRAAAATAVLALLGTAVVDPDRFIAEQNVARYHRTGRIDTAYLSGLSADALPALLDLPPGVRGCAVASIESSLAETRDDWRSWNLARARARELGGDPTVDLDDDCVPR